MKHLLLQALAGENVQRPPVWLMRQAGRYLPEYKVLQSKYDFFTRVQTPELAAEITMQPMERFGMDAAIIFSDILVVPQAMGLQVEMIDNQGPRVQIIKDKRDILQLNTNEAAEKLDYVYQALAVTKQALNGRAALIGFAGAPFTLLCYMIEGKGSNTFSLAKEFCFTKTEEAMLLLEKITEVTIAYAKKQVVAGAEVIQIFDSWSGLLSPNDFKIFAQPYLEKIARAVSPFAPVILFPKGSWYALGDLVNSTASAIGIDWGTTAKFSREQTKHNITLQGNFDPTKLLMPIKNIQEETKKMIDEFGVNKYIANLGHGIHQHTPIDRVAAFVDAVKNYSL